MTTLPVQGLINLDTIHKLQKNFFDEGAILTDIADCRTRNDVKEGIQIFFHVATQSPQDTSEVRS